MTDPMSQALDSLLKRIRAGQEFPDATASVCLRYGVCVDELREAYDDECVSRESTRGQLLMSL